MSVGDLVGTKGPPWIAGPWAVAQSAQWKRQILNTSNKYNH